DGIRDFHVTGVQTCALPISALGRAPIVDFDRSDGHQNNHYRRLARREPTGPRHFIPSSHDHVRAIVAGLGWGLIPEHLATPWLEIGRASCRERVAVSGPAGS